MKAGKDKRNNGDGENKHLVVKVLDKLDGFAERGWEYLLIAIGFIFGFV